MRLNKTYLAVGAGLLFLIAVTAVLVLKAPGRQAAKPAAPPVGLNKPRALAVSPQNGDLIIVDSRNNRLEVRRPDGSVAMHIGDPYGRVGEGKGEFHEPCGVAVDKAGDIFVADTFHSTAPKDGLPWGRIEKFDSAGNYLTEVDISGSGSPGLFGPRSVAVDPQGRVWVSDTGDSRLLVYDNNLKFIRAIGARGSQPLQFKEPFGLAVDDAGNVYVADRLNFRIQVINPDFGFVRQFKVDGWGVGQINQEPYLAVDNAHRWLWVSDPTHNRVLRYSLRGEHLKIYTKGNLGAVSVPFDLPTGLALASDGTLYVSDGGTGRILTLKF